MKRKPKDTGRKIDFTVRHGDSPTCWMTIDGKPPCDEHAKKGD